MVKRISFLILLFVSIFSVQSVAEAQPYGYLAEVSSNKVSVGSAFELRLTVHGTQDVSAPNIEIEGFEVRYTGPSTQIKVVNGKYSSSKTFVYTLFPLEVGMFQIPSFSIVLEGQEYTTRAILMEVVEASSVTSDSAVSADLSNNIFLTIKLAKDDVYMFEKVPAKIMLFFSNMDVPDWGLPEMEKLGFLMDELNEPKGYEQVFNGRRFRILEFSTNIYPTRSGELIIGPASLDVIGTFRQTPKRSSFDNMFADDFFGSLLLNRSVNKRLSIRSEEVSLNVKELPIAGKPKEFSGAVGKFDFDMSVSPVDVKVGDPITIRMTVQGDGNLDNISFPKITETNNVKLYDPLIKVEGNKMILEQVLIPKSTDFDSVDPITFSYFDTSFDEYKDIIKGPFKVSTTASLDQSAVLVSSNQQQQFSVPETLGEDIVYIKDRLGRVRSKGGVIYKQWLFYVAILILILLWSGMFIYYKQTHRLQTDSKYAKQFLAPKSARKNLSEAQQLINASPKEFYDQLYKTLNQYLSNKLQIATGSVSLESVAKKMNLSEGDEILLNIKHVLEQCDAVRYAAQSLDQSHLNDSLMRVTKIIDLVERSKV